MEDIFEKELMKETIFQDRNVLSPHYIPETLPHREKEVERIMKNLAPLLSGKRTNNLFIYGKTGTGKTASTKLVIEKLMNVKEKYNVNVDMIYINARVINTKYQVLLKIIEHLEPGESYIGYPFSHLYDKMLKVITRKNEHVIVILDEIDKIKSLDDLVYTLTRANDELVKGRISIIGITNNVMMKKKLDPRSKSTLCEEEMIFAPYNAEQLEDILNQRAEKGFKKGSVKKSAISYAAALAAQESGDARYALKLLLKAGEIADEKQEKEVTDKDVLKAREGVEEEIVMEAINTLPEHQKIMLYAIALLSTSKAHYSKLDGSKEDKVLFTGEIYEKYEALCNRLGKEARSARWGKEYINELEMLGLVTTTLSGKGVRGNTTLVRVAFDPEKIKRAIEKYFKE